MRARRRSGMWVMRTAGGIERRGESPAQNHRRRRPCTRFTWAIHVRGSGTGPCGERRCESSAQKNAPDGQAHFQLFDFSTRTHYFVQAFRSLNNLFPLA
jgi:hypothetical protein